jgi:hypothetical protein
MRMQPDEERIEDLVNGDKEFEKLDGETQQWVLRKLGSADEFRMLRQIHSGLSDQADKQNIFPNEQVMVSLRTRLKERHPAFRWADLFQFKIPAYAALLLTIASTIAFSTLTKTKTEPNEKIVNVPVVRIDTVYETVKDTIYVNNTVVRYVTIPIQVSSPILTASARPDPSGVTMKDKEELDKLLVSGIN